MRRWQERKNSKGTMIVPLDPCGFLAVVAVGRAGAFWGFSMRCGRFGGVRAENDPEYSKMGLFIGITSFNWRREMAN